MSRTPTTTRSAAAADADSSTIAADVKRLLDGGDQEAAAERFGDLVGVWQRRALRLALHYLGNPADADDAVQDAFVKLYGHMTSYRADSPFDAWFTRILVNACLDRAKARNRVRRWFLAPAEDENGPAPVDTAVAADPSPERRLLVAAKWRELSAAVRDLPARQRDVFLLCHLDEQAPAEVAAALGMSPATVRVHLFRALRKLRAALGGPL
ncbi:MAG: RNA polymerase sigma factor [Vicinamibacterales bacterium]